MSNTIRTFIAIDFNPQIRQAITEIQNRLRALDCNIKWVKPENIHLTLKFLGEVKLKKIDTIKSTLQDLLKEFQPIETELTQLGAFPDINHPNILWVGLKDDQRGIVKLAASIEEDLRKVGFKKEQKPFHPHITIGRIRSPKNQEVLSAAISEHPFPVGLGQTLDNISLYKSTLTSHGPNYEILEEFIITPT